MSLLPGVDCGVTLDATAIIVLAKIARAQQMKCLFTEVLTVNWGGMGIEFVSGKRKDFGFAY
ncbi:MAG: hypothetical protein ACFUZC_10425 [Chthoniobacteraceae bacterium]